MLSCCVIFCWETVLLMIYKMELRNLVKSFFLKDFLLRMLWRSSNTNWKNLFLKPLLMDLHRSYFQFFLGFFCLGVCLISCSNKTNEHFFLMKFQTYIMNWVNEAKDATRLKILVIQTKYGSSNRAWRRVFF
jgi:hypothetical protein